MSNKLNSQANKTIRKHKILLSICIATYNRANFIGATIESIVSQVNDNIEIIIIDGASPDNTQQVIREYQKNFTQIKYYRLLEKGGVDRDYCKAIEFAKGTYCWLFTDDDILDQNAVNTVLTAIKTKKYALIVLNAKLCSRDLIQCYHKKFLNFNSNKEYRGFVTKNVFLAMQQIIYLLLVVLLFNVTYGTIGIRNYILVQNFVHVGVIFQEKINGNALIISRIL